MVNTVVFLLAYVDPGTGTLIFQVLIAGFLVAITFFRDVFWRIGRGFGWVLQRLGLKRAVASKPPLGTEGSPPPPNTP